MSEPIPSATVVLLREMNQGIEVLLLKRNSKIAYGGAWVFPGGKIDASDYEPENKGVATADNNSSSPLDKALHNSKMLSAAQNAACRETIEEAGLHIDRDQLVLYAHWTTPVVRPKRFSTWFFLVPANKHEVTIDGGEIHDHSWRSPSDALKAHQAGEIELIPPTYLALLELASYSSVSDVMSTFSKKSPQAFEPRIEILPDGFCHLYEEDAGYEETKHDTEGARHRLYTKHNREWIYERSI